METAKSKVKRISQEVEKLYNNNSFPCKDENDSPHFIETFIEIDKKLRVLSFREVFAYLIALGIKDVENRSWNTKIRGTVLIHVSGRPILNEHSLNYFPEGYVKKYMSHAKSFNTACSFSDYVIENKEDYFNDEVCEDITELLECDSKLLVKLNNVFELYMCFCDELDVPVCLETFDLFRWDFCIDDMPSWKFDEKKGYFMMDSQVIIGQVDIIDCKKGVKSRWASSEEDYQFVLNNAILYDEPLRNVKGKLGFWRLPS